MASSATSVIVGVDTHSATHHVAVLDAATGQVLGDREVAATTSGYCHALEFASGYGAVTRWGIEGTNSYGAGLSRHLRTAGHQVYEVIRPNRAARRLQGKSDPLDAITAGREALARTDLPEAKTGDGDIESIRVLSITRETAVKARTAVLNQIAMIMVNAPAPLRESLQHLTRARLLDRLLAARPGTDPTASVTNTTMIALQTLARRHRTLTQEITTTTKMLTTLTQAAAPALMATSGVGVVTAAQLLITVGDNPERIHSQPAFAALCGVSPIPASSGKTNRHRLNRGGDRAANAAIHQIAIGRMRQDPRTQNYIAKKAAEGKTTKEALRCLKRHIANEMFNTITNPKPIPDTTDLRPTRTALGLTITAIAKDLGVTPARISEIERGTRRNDTLANHYRQRLNQLDNQ